MQIHDISRVLAPTTATWPGERPFEREWSARLGVDGSVVNVGAIHLSTHTATHADAPLHHEAAGKSINEVPLLHFLGTCQVVQIQHRGAIYPRALGDLDAVRRVLFRTPHSDISDDKWEDRFAYFVPETIEWLAARGIVLIGTDAPSVDPADSKKLPAHHALARHGIVNLENLMLRDVSPGIYELIALPLKLVGLDASPVRAVLIER